MSASHTPSNKNTVVNNNGGNNIDHTDGKDNKYHDISLMEFVSSPLSMAAKSTMEGDGNLTSFNEFKSGNVNVSLSNGDDSNAFGNGFSRSVRW